MTPEQRVRGAFGIGELRTGRIDAHAEVRRDLRLFVGLAVAVRVAAEPQVWRGADERAVAVQHQRAGQNDVIEEDRTLVHAAISVRIAEHDHRAFGLGFRRAVEVFHVARHLHDPEATVGGELQDRRVTDQRGLGDELDAVTRGDLEGAQRLFGGKRGRRRDQVRRDDRHLLDPGLVGLVADLGAERRGGQAKGGEEVTASGHTHKDNMNAPRLPGQSTPSLYPPFIRQFADI